MTRNLGIHQNLEFNLKLFGLIQPMKEIQEIKSFNTQMEIICESTDLEDLYENSIIIIEKKASDFQIGLTIFIFHKMCIFSSLK